MMKGNEKDCIFHKPKDKHTRRCDAFRLSEFLKQEASIKCQVDENLKNMNHGLIYDQIKQMSENHAIKIDTHFWLVVRQKPKWMPSFLYRATIKNLIELQEHRK